MKTHTLAFGKRTAGRPPVVDLTPADLREIQAHYLKTNRNKKEGSILLSWVRFCESRPALSHLVENHMPATTIPTAVIEACRQAKPLVGPARGGAPRLRHESAYVPGTMRRHHAKQMRLMAGDRASIDDATRNVACWIPWPWGGCPCSEKYGVRLGRWQTLIVHDDATSYVPFVSSVFRWQQSYRSTDAAAAIYRTETDVLKFDHWSIEGGVWQAKRTLEILAGRFISAKGRPNQKLVENWIGRLWNIMAGQPGDVGRHRGEMKSASELYVKARQGRVDPRDHFMSLSDAQQALYASIDYLNEKRIDSRTYGTWVPKDRWISDLAESPRAARSDADSFLIRPVAETRKVIRGSISITEDGPLGVPMVWKFIADWLWNYEGRQVTAYFDPLSEWPVQAVVTLAGDRKPLGIVECVSPIDNSRDRATEMVKAVRQTMMSEFRNIAKGLTDRTLRHPEGVASIIVSGTPDPAASTGRTETSESIAPADRGRQIEIATPPQDRRAPLAATPRITRDDLASSLSRRAALLEDA
jgi:hypothetical protein